MAGAPRCQNPNRMHAFVDASLRAAGDGLYMVAAAVVGGDFEVSRQAAQNVLLAR